MPTLSPNEQRAERGKTAIKAHPDYVANDILTSVTDTIADVLHGAHAMGLFDGPYTPDAILGKAITTYIGDAEDDDPEDEHEFDLDASKRGAFGAALTAKTGKCERCGTEQPLDAEGRVQGHKAPRARKFCLGSGGRPRKS